MQGSLPSELGRLTKLRTLHIERNWLTGPIPAEIGNMSALESLRLIATFSPSWEMRALPHELGKLSELRDLTLSGGIHRLSTVAGTIPTTIGHLSHLQRLDVSFNFFLTGTIPTELVHLKNLTTLILRATQLHDVLPAEIGQLTSLDTLAWDDYMFWGFQFGVTMIHGTLPSTLGRLTRMSQLELWGHNRLTGTIPSELGNLVRLTKLLLSLNSLNGTIPSELGNVRLSLSLFVHATTTGDVHAR